MKLIHVADLHIGSKFSRITDETKKKELDAALNNSFKRVVDYANDNDIQTILLSGDVFDKDSVLKGDKEYFYNIIKSNPNIDFYYIKGNHDIKSKYVEGVDNLHTFDDNEKIQGYLIKENNVLISGYELNDGNNSTLYDMPPFTKDNYNIFLLHGDISKKSGKDSINIDKLIEKNIDYLALGHIHKGYFGKAGINMNYVYPGCLMGRGFDETGKKGFYVINTDTRTFDFVVLPNRIFQVEAVNVSNVDNNYDLIKQINSLIKGNQDMLLQIVLEGTLNFELNIDLIKEDTLRHFYFVDIKNSTKLSITQYDEIDERSLKGMFIKLIKEDKTLDDSTKERVLRYGLSKINKGEAWKYETN